MTETGTVPTERTSRSRLGMYLFAAVAMCYGWGWRGAYGHEAGAMVPGALVGMAVCLASARQDWYRRALVAGLCGAIGWAWGGTLTNMEHRLYILSDTPVDVLYGFACIGLVGLLWSGVGGAILAMAFTRPRSELNRFIGPVTVLGATYLLMYLYFFFNPDVYQVYVDYTEKYWHDGEWLDALAALAVLGPYWFLRARDRPATTLMLLCAAAWWVGYGGWTKLGGLELAPPYRSESWAGVVGMQVVLIGYHFYNRDRAAIVFTLYAMLAGCIGFILALQIHVPFVVAWGLFSDVSPWKIAEESFGFFMGFGVAMGAGRLLGGRLAPPAEDADREPLDLYSVFVLLIVMMWMNLKRNVIDWGDRYDLLPDEPFGLFKEPFPQVEAWQYFLAVGVVWTGLVLYCLVQYCRGRLALAPRTEFEKGALVFILIVVTTLAGAITLRVSGYKNPSALTSGFSFLMLAGVSVWMLLARSEEAMIAQESHDTGTPASDPSWQVGWKYWALWAWVPVHVVIASVIALAMVEEPWRKDQGLERHRFGPKATWRLELERQQEEEEEKQEEQ